MQVSVDRPSVNWKPYEKVEKSWNEVELRKLVNICSCSLHVIYGALKTGLILCFLQHLNITSFFCVLWVV